MPRTSAEAFDKLYEKKMIDAKTLKWMRGMVGFRDVVVNEYQRINFAIVDTVITNQLNDFRVYSNS